MYRKVFPTDFVEKTVLSLHLSLGNVVLGIICDIFFCIVKKFKILFGEGDVIYGNLVRNN